MATKSTSSTKINPLQLQVLRVARWHFWLVLAFVASIIVFDAWKLIAPEDVLNRWKIAAVMLAVATAAWYSTKSTLASLHTVRLALYALIALDIAAATQLVYSERGMASRAVMLYVIPILMAGLLNRASALFATASICVAAYSYAAVKYFVVFFNEGLKAELYTTIAFYSAVLFIIAGIVSVLIERPTNK